MKTLFKILSIGLFISFAYSCNSDDPDVIINNLKEGQIEIKVSPDGGNKVSFSAAVANITIDWGDGSIEEFTPNGTTKEFTHSYADKKLRTITIDTELMTQFDLDLGYYEELRFGDSPELNGFACSNRNLTVLSIKKAPALTWLYCADNQLKSLDVSGCTALKELYCGDNQLKTLNVSRCTVLEDLGCSGNQLTSLNISKCLLLTELYCSNNQLTSLDVSKCSMLNILVCSNNKLTKLDVSMCIWLTDLQCYINQLTSLDISRCAGLIRLGDRKSVV